MAFGCIMTGGGRIKGDATPDTVLEGKTFSSINGKDLVGTIKNNGTVVTLLDTTNTMQVLEGYYARGSRVEIDVIENTDVTLETNTQIIQPANGKLLNKVTIPGVPGEASAGAVLNGYSFSGSVGINVLGTMPNFSATTVSSSNLTTESGYLLIGIPNAGYYQTNSKLKVPVSTVEPSSLKKSVIWTSSPADIKAIFPSTYTKMNANDFYVGVTNASMSSSFADTGWATNDGVSTSCSISISKSYNATEGKLYFSVAGGSASAAGADYAMMRSTISASGIFAAYRGTIAGSL